MITMQYKPSEEQERVLHHISTRPGMYIGKIGNGSNPRDGIYFLLEEVVNNSLHEHESGYGDKIIINITQEGKVSVRDFGRGIAAEKLISIFDVRNNTNNSFDDGVVFGRPKTYCDGIMVVNALCDDFHVKSYQNGTCSTAIFHQWRLVSNNTSKTTEKDGLQIEFAPDSTLFEKFSYDLSIVNAMAEKWSCLCRGLEILVNDQMFKSENGLYDILHKLTDKEFLYEPIHIKNDNIEILFTHCNSDGEIIASFTNGRTTDLGGIHVNALRDGVIKGFNTHFRARYSEHDCLKGFVGIISLWLQNPMYGNRIKTCLSGLSNKNYPGIIDYGLRPFIVGEIDNYLHLLKHGKTECNVKQMLKENEKHRGNNTH